MKHMAGELFKTMANKRKPGFGSDLYVPGSKLPLVSMVGDDHETHSVGVYMPIISHCEVFLFLY